MTDQIHSRSLRLSSQVDIKCTDLLSSLYILRRNYTVGSNITIKFYILLKLNPN